MHFLTVKIRGAKMSLSRQFRLSDVVFATFLSYQSGQAFFSAKVSSR